MNCVYIAFAVLLIIGISRTDGYELNDEKAAEIARLASTLPNLNYTIRKYADSSEADWVQLTNGRLTSGGANRTCSYFGCPFVSATLSDRVLFGDINGDGNMDAVVIVLAVYHGIGYFDSFILPVISDGHGNIKAYGGVGVGEHSIWRVDRFDFTEEEGVVSVSFLDRKPGEAKVMAPSVPTFLKLKFENERLVIKEKSTTAPAQ